VVGIDPFSGDPDMSSAFPLFPARARLARFDPRLTLAGCLLMAAAPAIAQPVLKAGLWEVQMKNAEMDAAMKQFQAQIAAMPPAQRAQMEKALGERGAGLGAGGAIKVCHTADSLKQHGPVAEQSGCTTRTSWRGNNGSFEMSCKDGRTGKGEFLMTGQDAYKGSFQMTDPKRPGQGFQMEQTGRWVSTDCGKVKPFTAAANPAPTPR